MSITDLKSAFSDIICAFYRHLVFGSGIAIKGLNGCFVEDIHGFGFFSNFSMYSCFFTPFYFKKWHVGRWIGIPKLYLSLRLKANKQ
jgi:hypothetical protein